MPEWENYTLSVLRTIGNADVPLLTTDMRASRGDSMFVDSDGGITVDVYDDWGKIARRLYVPAGNWSGYAAVAGVEAEAVDESE